MGKKISAASCWTPRESAPGVSEFATEYLTYEVKDVVKKVGEGDEDYVLEKKIIEHKDSIKGVIDSQAGEVGVYNLIERVLRTGDTSLIPQVELSEDIADYTKLPEDLAEAHASISGAHALYNSLPEALKKEKSYEDIATMSLDDLVAWLSSFTKKTDTKTEGGAE